MIFVLIFVENCLQYNAMHDFSVRPQTRPKFGYETILVIPGNLKSCSKDQLPKRRFPMAANRSNGWAVVVVAREKRL